MIKRRNYIEARYLRMRPQFVILCLLAFLPFVLPAQNAEPFVWKGSTLMVNDGNSLQEFEWKNGRLILKKAKNIAIGREISFNKPLPTYNFSEDSALQTRFELINVPATTRTSEYRQLDLLSVFNGYEIKESLRIYTGCSGIEWRLAVRGEKPPVGHNLTENNAMIERPELLRSTVPYYHYIPFGNRHVTTRFVSFREATDHHSNLIKIQDDLPYRRQQYYKGNVMLAKDNVDGNTQIAVKLSPLESAQSGYFGFDFSTDFEGAKIHSPGFEILKSYNAESGWMEAYAIYTLLFAEDEEHALNHYKNYELAVHRYIPESDNTLTMNTWGDRNKDSRVNENFILKELDAAKRLGITHYQIDDGWQQGLSQNSSQKAGVLWDDWADDAWKVNTERFPGGLKKITDKAKALDIVMGLWFNPSKKNNYTLWERDKNILEGLHRQHNISWIKIDGLEIGNKLSERRVSNLLQQASASTNGRLQFNIDVTAGKRGGFFFLNRVGNIFLENRYTDWGNYYPHLTLRNVWQLSKYVPLQRIQIEWLNKWRNAAAYPKNDPLRPQNIPFDYQFAITMMGQPLAWMEATGLPNEAFGVTPLIKTWQKHRREMQTGIIHPVGQMPDGYSFPGFVSYTKNKVFVLLFRENTGTTKTTFDLPLSTGIKNSFVRLAGAGTVQAAKRGMLDASFPAPFSFVFGYFNIN